MIYRTLIIGDGGYSAHQVLDSHIDIAQQQFVITVGSWPSVVDGEPWCKTATTIHIDQWLPEYCLSAEDFVASSPEWGGMGPSRPSEAHQWAPLTLEWYLPPVALKQLKDDQWAKVKKARSLAEYAGFVWDGSVFDSNAVSQQRITGAFTLAQLSPAFAIDWTLADNSVRTLDAQQMCAVGMALGVHVATQFARAQALRELIYAAVDAQEVLAVEWSVQ